MTQFKIGITDYISAPFDIEQRVLGSNYELIPLDLFAEFPATEILNDLDGLLIWHYPIEEQLLNALTNCQILVRYGVGYDNVDLQAVKRHGMRFSNTPDYGTDEVADTTCAMILAKTRRIAEYNIRSRGYLDTWQENTLADIQRSSALTVGVIGAGRIGSSVILRLKAFNYNLVFFDPYQPSGYEKMLGCSRVDTLEALCQTADIVTLHCPLTTETRGMVNTDFLSNMKAGAILINTARGPLIENIDQVLTEVESDRLYGVGLDVLPEEPPLNSKYISQWRSDTGYLNGRVTINPHSAYYSSQAWNEMRSKSAETIKLWLEQGIQRNPIVSEAE